jgi:hypothetical protein
VEVTKGPITALLCYRVPMTEQMRPPPANVNDYFWVRDVTPRFDVQGIDRRRQDLAYSQTEYLEGDATDRSTGAHVYIGMNLSTAKSQFFITANGTYTSQHVGAYGMVGTSKVYSETYSGQFAMNGNWEVTFTNRFEGKPETFAAQFEIVQGGRILHLMNVRATGIRCHLGRVP